MNKLKLIAVFVVVSLQTGLAQTNADAFVDEKGVIRWGDSKEEVQGFGVNYTVPFAHAYRVAKQLGVSHKSAIDDDVYHFARLGFDAYRVHVWDTEISDSVGNLLHNDHLDLFDYALKQMKDRGMKFILTPIAYWGNGYPEPAENTPGFADKYGKAACLTEEDAIKAQEVYLFQFLNHVNPYTGVAYKEDPDIIAFEISNEPHHAESKEKVSAFVGRLVSSMKRTGCKKPIFYNVSHSIELVDAYYGADIDGGTFQWYPTGLGSQEELSGNLLPNVDRYPIPFADHPAFSNHAKIVYEFDAADVGRSYIYPAMARSFREAGMQWATHFAYDPTFMAFANTEYNTHYMNLAYTPQKALSLKISSEVFHVMPMYKSYGRYPHNIHFGPFRIDYENDLAEMLTEKKFFYTNNTPAVPINEQSLEEIAGVGSSALVQYKGTGAYFLDRIATGVWRLEVMPDAIWIKDPFGRNSLQRKVAVINWRSWPMTISLKELGGDFTIMGIGKTAFSSSANQGKFDIEPGVYILSNRKSKKSVDPEMKFKNVRLNEFVAPGSNLDRCHVVHTPNTQILANSSYQILAKVVTKEPPVKVEVFFGSGRQIKVQEMTDEDGYLYTLQIPASELTAGYFEYFISVTESNGKITTFPCVNKGHPRSWDFYCDQPFRVDVLAKGGPLYLFNAEKDFNELSRAGNRNVRRTPMEYPGRSELKVEVDDLTEGKGDIATNEKIYNYAMRYYFRKKIAGREDELTDKKEVIIEGRSLTEKDQLIHIAFIAKDGTAFGGHIKLGVNQGEYRLRLQDLKSEELVILPRPYPTFLPYYFKTSKPGTFDCGQLEAIQISVGPGLEIEMRKMSQAFALQSIRLE